MTKPIEGASSAEQVSTEKPSSNIASLEIDLAAGRVKLGGQPVPLTRLEFRVLSDLANHAGRVISASELLQAVWKCDPGAVGTTDPVRGCIKRLRQKIELDPRHPTFIVTAYGSGYLVPLNAIPRNAMRVSFTMFEWPEN